AERQRHLEPDAAAQAAPTDDRRHEPRRRLLQRCHVDAPLARPVELAEEDPLPGPERKPAAVERNEDLRAHQRGADVRGRILLALLDVLPAPAVADDPLERSLEVARDSRVGVLVDRHPGGRVRHVDERRRRAVGVAERPRGGKAQSLGAAVNGGGGIRELWRFACEGYLGNLTREHEERAAMLEAELQVTLDGETIPYRMIRPVMANEPERSRRQELD